MPLPLITAKASKSMPYGKGTYGSKKGRPPAKKKGAKKEMPAFMKKKGTKKK